MKLRLKTGRKRPKIKSASTVKRGADYNKNQADLMRRKRAEARDVGSHPHTNILAEKKRYKNNLSLFARRVFPSKFYLELSDDHKQFISQLQNAILKGGEVAIGMPRGSGKTTIVIAACLWATLYGHRRYLVVITAEASLAQKIVGSIRAELETNKKLMALFPEICHYISALEGVKQRAATQTTKGELTRMRLNNDCLIYPHFTPRPAYLEVASQAVIEAKGLTGSIRGLLQSLPDGSTIRPDFVFLDDPQTRESALSEHQCAYRQDLINTDIAGLAGPTTRISMVATVTVIRDGDLADTLLKTWRSTRSKMIISWPETSATLWNEYIDLRLSMRQSDDKTKICNAFYRARRAKMDKGAKVYWRHRKNEEDVSALQHAYNFIADRGMPAFMAEYQNEPHNPADELAIISVFDLERKTNGYPRGQVPLEARWLTFGCDVHDDLIYYVVTAWAEDRRGFIVDYGTFPDQKLGHFTLASAPVKLGDVFKNAGKEAAIQAGLKAVVEVLLKKNFPVFGGGERRVDKALVDGGYKPAQVQAVKREVGGAVMDMSKGVGIKAGRRPLTAMQHKPGEKHGYHWYYPNIAKTREFPYCMVDTNFWKSWAHQGLATPAGDPGSITLFGDKRTNHRLFAEHVAGSERYVETEGHGRKVREWSQLPGRPDNHSLDCLVYAATAASVAGMRLPEQDELAIKRKPKIVSFAEMQRRHREHG